MMEGANMTFEYEIRSMNKKFETKLFLLSALNKIRRGSDSQLFQFQIKSVVVNEYRTVSAIGLAVVT